MSRVVRPSKRSTAKVVTLASRASRRATFLICSFRPKTSCTTIIAGAPAETRNPGSGRPSSSRSSNVSVAIDVMLHRGRALMLPSVFRGLPRTFWVLWIGIIIDRLGGFAFAFLTLYLTSERHLGVDEATAIVSLAGLGGLAGALAGGILADHLGRKTTIIVGSTSAALTLGAIAFVREPLPIAALWLVNGLASGAVRPA